MKTAEEKARELYPGDSFEEDYDLDDDLLDCCPKCGRYYDEIGADLQYCKACGWDAENKKFDKPIKPTDDDFMAGEADILTGKWN